MIFTTLYLLLAGLLFVIGMVGFLTRRNVLIMFMSVEIMLNAVNLTFVTFSRIFQLAEGQLFVFLSMAISACEVALGLAIIVQIFQQRGDVDVDQFNLLRDE